MKSKKLSGALCCAVAVGLSTLVHVPSSGVVIDGAPITVPESSYIGRWRGASAVAIGPNHAITAKHNGGTTANSLNMQSHQYQAVALYPHPTADIMIIEVDEPLPGWHEIADSVSTGQTVVLGGMGYHAGESTPYGFYWTNFGGERWALNDLEFVTNYFLGIEFDDMPFSGHEGIFALYDSGGGLFVVDENAQLRLAGIAISIDSLFGFSAFGDRAYAINMTSYKEFVSSIVYSTQECLGDLNGSGSVDFFDLLLLLSNWGSDNPTTDLNDDGVTDTADLTILLTNFGSDCPGSSGTGYLPDTDVKSPDLTDREVSPDAKGG